MSWATIARRVDALTALLDAEDALAFSLDPTTPPPFEHWLENEVQIESDNPDVRGAIPFQLHPYQRERVQAWVEGDSEVILKARQLGFTWLVAAYALWTAAYHPSSHVAVFSKSGREMRKLLRRIRFIWRRLPPGLQAGGVPARESFAFANESVITGFPSTEDAGIGETNRLVIFDEWAFHPYGEANLAAVLPTISAGGQFIALSTADPELGPTGHFHDAYQAAAAGESGFQGVFVPWWARPERQTAGGSPDPAWLDHERRRYASLTSEAFDAFYPANPEDAFQGRDGLVYPMFDPQHHVRETPPVPWDETWSRRYATDYGGGDPSAVVVAGTWRGVGEGFSRIHVYGLHYRSSGAPTVEEIVGYLGQWSGDVGWTQGEGDPAPGGEVINASLRASGFPCRRGHAKRDEGIGLVGQYLERGWLTFDPSCAALFRELRSYRWKPGTDPNSKERYATKTPADHHADALDALRLLVVGVWRDELNSSGFREVYSHVEW